MDPNGFECIRMDSIGSIRLDPFARLSTSALTCALVSIQTSAALPMARARLARPPKFAPSRASIIGRAR